MASSRPLLLAALLAALLGTAAAPPDAWAQGMDAYRMPPAAATPAGPAPRLSLAAALARQPLHTLPPAATAATGDLAALRAWNDAGKLPFRNGFSRLLDAPVSVDLGLLTAPPAAAAPLSGGLVMDAGGGQVAWGTRIEVEDAYRLRLHLTAVHLPAGTRFLVSGATGAPRQFGLELLSPAGDLWTPSVFGSTLLFEVQVPAGARQASFSIPDLLEIFRAGQAAAAAPPSCLVDSSCIGDGVLPGVAGYRHAVAQLYFVDLGVGYLCSGGLLADTQQDNTPYLLTANHCFADQPTAATLEAVFDFVTNSCGGQAPAESTLPTVNGSTLLASGMLSDFTLVRLGSVPPGRTFLGWEPSAGALQQGTQLYRLSHPAYQPNLSSVVVLPQQFSQSTLQTGNSVPLCSSTNPRPEFVYATLTRGGTFGGSSGAPLLIGNGRVVGQLNGGCGFDPTNGCDYSNSELDGAFSVTYPFIQQWLTGARSPAGPCAADANTLCIDRNPGDRRFQVRVSYATVQGGGSSGNGNAIALDTLGVTQGGLFWFFAATNPEMLVKIIDGCSLNSSFWVFYAATTNVGFTLTVTDTTTGHVQSYTNPDTDAAAPVQDTGALSCS